MMRRRGLNKGEKRERGRRKEKGEGGEGKSKGGKREVREKEKRVFIRTDNRSQPTLALPPLGQMDVAASLVLVYHVNHLHCRWCYKSSVLTLLTMFWESRCLDVPCAIVGS
ncbi:hypothetical protein Pmani_021374 [Petrolisthes manimaculis]|uniref:Uncharacterized protein n=1 Tax=Petrolisthes manimaculis TaxID=1843537 RepID=A0AAE1PDY8_9EUCA|nr:hypothetical protein Pmani_021374 [Petrolisthes manimaculis]